MVRIIGSNAHGNKNELKIVEALNEKATSVLDNNLKEYVKLTDENIGENYDKYKKAKEYLLSLDDDELNKIAHEFVKADIDEISPSTLIKLLVKVSPKALLKLGKLF